MSNTTFRTHSEFLFDLSEYEDGSLPAPSAPVWDLEAPRVFDVIAATDQALAIEAKQGNRDALEELFRRFRPIAQKLAPRYANSHLDVDDIESICIEKCMKALANFDATRGQIMGYFVSRSQHGIIDYIRRHGRSGRGNANAAKKYREALKEAREQHGKDYIDLKAFAKANRVSIRRAIRIAVTCGGSIPLDCQRDRAGGSLGDVIPSDAPSPAEAAELESSISFIQAKVATLADNERLVIERYFGLNGRPAESFAAIGADFGVTMQRVQQIFKSGIETMRQHAARLDKPALPAMRCALPNANPPKKWRRRRRAAPAKEVALAA